MSDAVIVLTAMQNAVNVEPKFNDTSRMLRKNRSLMCGKRTGELVNDGLRKQKQQKFIHKHYTVELSTKPQNNHVTSLLTNEVIKSVEFVSILWEEVSYESIIDNCIEWSANPFVRGVQITDIVEYGFVTSSAANCETIALSLIPVVNGRMISLINECLEVNSCVNL
jgi:hypothetical protein